MPWPSLSYSHQHSRQKHLKLSVQLESLLTDGVSLSETERETVGIESRFCSCWVSTDSGAKGMFSNKGWQLLDCMCMCMVKLVRSGLELTALVAPFKASHVVLK